MTVEITPRDYSLIGKDAQLAEANGLAAAQWYHSEVPRKRMKELMQRKDGPAIRDTALWFALLGLSGFGGWHFWGSIWAIPFFGVYGILYGSASDSRWHECGHRTAFKTTWMNDAVYYIACFMILREPNVWRWSHTRHHTDTIIVGRDPEIAVMRPPVLAKLILNLVGIPNGISFFSKLATHAMGRLTPDEETFIPKMERNKVYWTARVLLALFAGVIAWCFAIGSILPAMFIGLPSFYGTFMHIIYGLTQHAGLAEDVLDHRLNSRTVYMNPVNRFLYWNMNYHIEHHMFPMVPYHALPALHEEIKNDLPKPYPSIWAAYKEILPAIARQLRDPSYFVKRELPAGAKPYVDDDALSPVPAE